MSLLSNKRLFWAVQQIGFAEDGSESFTEAHGVQSMGVTTTFNLNEIFEIGEISLYDNVEDTPDVEVTLEKVLDGYPLLYHLATPNSPGTSLVGRSNERCILALSTFGDTQQAASGVPNAQMNASGLYVSNINYNFPAEDNFTESITLVGNHKVWNSGAPFTFSGVFDNEDSPASGIMRRQYVNMGTGSAGSLWPKGTNGIPGIDANGKNPEKADGSSYQARIQNVTITTDLGREQLVELGRRNPFFRYATFPVEVTCDIEVLSTDGDFISATEDGILGDGENVSNQQIVLKTEWGTNFDLGTKNKLSNVEFNISTDGSNNIDTYSFSNFNDLTVEDPNDPASA